VFELRAFHKKTQKTRKTDLQLGARRYQQMTGD
jgi:phage-related protein